MKYDPSSRNRLFVAIRHDNALRAPGVYSRVIARKTGLPPSGSTMGKSALRKMKRVLAASSIGSVSALPRVLGVRLRQSLAQVIDGQFRNNEAEAHRQRDQEGAHAVGECGADQ